jgi:RNA-binding protein YhbY|tara:strand:+ start:439 stop:690 length:252 start_codon:yes stop_codon:yes gene_type:complete
MNKKLKREMQDLKITVRIGFNGIKESLIKEIKDQLNSRNMIKLKANKGVLDVSSRKTFWQELADKTNSKVINQIGNVAVFTKK